MYGPRGTQVARTLAALTRLGWMPAVVCLDPRRGGPHWPDGAPPPPLAGVELVRVASPQEWLLTRAAYRLAPPLRDRPDPASPWIGPAARAANRLASTTRFAGLITFAQPWSDHLIGLRVRESTRLPWVAHFSDPWADSPYGPPSARTRSRWRRWEADVIGAADAVVFVSDETADLVMKKYPPEWRRKAAVVPPGFEGAVTVPVGGRRPGPLRLTHTGRFYAEGRRPDALIEALARMHARAPLDAVVRLTLVGPGLTPYRRLAEKKGLSQVVEIRDRVPPADAAAMAADADVLLVIDAPATGAGVFLPSKLVDYLPHARPILGLTPPGSATASVLGRLECPMAPPDDVGAICLAIERLIQCWRAGTLRVGPAFAAVAGEYHVARTTERLSAVMKGAFARHGH